MGKYDSEESVGGNAANLLVKQTQAATKVQIVEPVCETKGVYYTFNPVDGELEQRLARNPRMHRALDFDNLVALACYMRDHDTENDVLIMHGEDMISAFIDDERRDNKATLLLPLDRKFSALQKLCDFDDEDGPEPIPHRDLISLMHRTLRGGIDLNVVNNLRQVRIETKAESKHAAADHSLSKESFARVQGTDNLPESIWVETVVYDPSVIPDAESYRIEVLIEFDDRSGGFFFLPVPRDLDVAMQATADFIAERLASQVSGQERIHVFHGNP